MTLLRDALIYEGELCKEQGMSLDDRSLEALAAKDVEIERLKTVPMKYRRMAFNAQLQDENAQLCQQVTLLHDALKQARHMIYYREPQIGWNITRIDEVIEATKEK